MRPGPLDRKITIEKRSVSRSVHGDVEVTWSTEAQPWADRKDSGIGDNTEEEVASKTSQQFRTTFTIRWQSGLNNKMRVIDGSELFNIMHVEELGGRNEIIKLHCEKIIET